MIMFIFERGESGNSSFEGHSGAMRTWTARGSSRHKSGAKHTMTVAYKGTGCSFESVKKKHAVSGKVSI